MKPEQKREWEKAVVSLMMGRVPAARAVLVIVWLCHVLCFGFGVRTITEEEAERIISQ